MGGSGYWEVAYTYAKATTGRNTVRRTQVTLPGGELFKYHYRTGTASHDDKASRVSAVRDASDADLAAYQYNGVGHVVRTNLDEVGIFSKAYTGSSTTFGRLDRFNRTTISSWTRDISPLRDLYKVTLGYDRNSNITFQDDAVHTGHDVAYVNDGLNRLIDADEGTLSGGSIGSRTRRQQWTLNQTGNWNRDKVDLNGDGLYTAAGELDDTRTHNVVNELTARDTNSSSPAEHSFAYDAAGNMTDDGQSYTYEWDAFYRLRKVRNRSNSALVSEYWYNGLGYLVTRHQDTDTDGDVDGSDVKFHSAYDERWRQVATFRGSDSSPKEQFVYHCAGNGGWGGSSYIDSVLLRDRDMTNGWTGGADGTLEERIYLLQNWRADVVAIVEPDGEEEGGAVMLEWIKYSAYGVPFALPAGDTDSDGDCDSTDDAQVTTWKNAPAYDIRGDLDLDGDVDATDESLVAGAHQSLGRGVLASTAVGNRKGYAGYEGDSKLSAKWHVRHRVLDSVLGRWLRRDPIDYRTPLPLLVYVEGRPAVLADPSGLSSCYLGDPNEPTGPCSPKPPQTTDQQVTNGWRMGVQTDGASGGTCPDGKCKFRMRFGPEAQILGQGGQLRWGPIPSRYGDWAESWNAWHDPDGRGDIEWESSGDRPGTTESHSPSQVDGPSFPTDVLVIGPRGSHSSQPIAIYTVKCGGEATITVTASSPLPVPSAWGGVQGPPDQGQELSLSATIKLSCSACPSGGTSVRCENAVPESPLY